MDWISVEDMLPGDETFVIVSCKEGIKEAEFWGSDLRGHRGKWFFEAPYYGQDLSCHFSSVTHWMPLPEPPIEKPPQ